MPSLFFVLFSRGDSNRGGTYYWLPSLFLARSSGLFTLESWDMCSAFGIESLPFFTGFCYTETAF